FRNILAKAENAIFVAGSPYSMIEGLTLENVQLEVNQWSGVYGGIYDYRPGYPSMVYANTSLLYMEHVKDVTISGLNLKWGSNPQPWWGQSVVAKEHTVKIMRVTDMLVEDHNL